MQRLLLKALYLVAALRYPALKKELRYFVRDNFYCKLFQLKFLFRDYVQKKAYQVTDYHGEFDQELRYILPYAYWHYLNGTLSKTISANNTKEFYFFSTNHEERYKQRVWTESYAHYDVPNMTHSNSYSFNKWASVPYKEQYKNEIFIFSKPILVIANKYNREWDQPPINFLNLSILSKIIEQYGDNYQIIYNRPQPQHIVQDNSEVLDLKEHDWLRENYPGVLLMDDLYRSYQGKNVKNYNHLQLMIYANCTHFISMHGGTAALASCFGGKNIILSNPNWGFEHPFNEYNTLFPKLSGATIFHAKKADEILTYLENHY